MEDDKMNNQNIKGEESKKIFTTSETILLVIFSLIIGISIGFLFNKGKIITQSTINKDEHLNEFVKNLFVENIKQLEVDIVVESRIIYSSIDIKTDMEKDKDASDDIDPIAGLDDEDTVIPSFLRRRSNF